MFKSVLIFIAVMVFGAVVWTIFLNRPMESEGRMVSLALSRGPFTVYDFPSGKAETTAIIIFASGDGGWDTLEEDISQNLSSSGYTVIGIDSRLYAKTDYDLAILQEDFTRIAQSAEVAFGKRPVPLIIGGYSMGAAQAIAVGGGPKPPPGLVGLILVDPCDRGRYGLRTQDQLDVLPTGPGTFAMEEFATTMSGLRIVQWHATEDRIDSQKWLDVLTAPHQLYNSVGNGHEYEGNRDAFLAQFVASLDWILHPELAGKVATEKSGDSR